MRGKQLKLLFFAVAAISVLLLSGCVQQTTKAPSQASAKLDVPFKLGIGQTAAVGFENLRISLINVTSDSRCPSDVQCVWAGEASVLMKADKNGKDLGTFKLSTAGSASNTSKFFNGYSIKLVTVEPYPKSTQRIQPSEYSVTFVVSKEILGALAQSQQDRISPSLSYLIKLKTEGGTSPDSEASKALSEDSASIAIEFRRELSQSELKALESSGVEFELVGGDVSHTGRFYNADIKWERMFEALDELTSLPEVVQVDSKWKPRTIPPSS